MQFTFHRPESKCSKMLLQSFQHDPPWASQLGVKLLLLLPLPRLLLLLPRLFPPPSHLL